MAQTLPFVQNTTRDIPIMPHIDEVQVAQTTPSSQCGTAECITQLGPLLPSLLSYTFPTLASFLCLKQTKSIATTSDKLVFFLDMTFIMQL
jgi:hypothetical protein